MENRINPLSISSPAERQTPRDGFGAMLARGVTTGSEALFQAASAIVPGGAVISAAVTRTAGTGLVGGGELGVGGGGQPARTSIAGAAGSASGADGLEGQRELMLQNQRWTAQYLSLQNDMQRESREFNTLSNILKVRHESAKTAINNIR